MTCGERSRTIYGERSRTICGERSRTIRLDKILILVYNKECTLKESRDEL